MDFNGDISQSADYKSFRSHVPLKKMCVDDDPTKVIYILDLNCLITFNIKLTVSLKVLLLIFLNLDDFLIENIFIYRFGKCMMLGQDP